jgi:hypothetical protein
MRFTDAVWLQLLTALTCRAVARAADCPTSIQGCRFTPGYALPKTVACYNALQDGEGLRAGCCAYQSLSGSPATAQDVTSKNVDLMASEDAEAYRRALCLGDDDALAGMVPYDSTESSTSTTVSGGSDSSAGELMYCGCGACGSLPAAVCVVCCQGQAAINVPILAPVGVRASGCGICREVGGTADVGAPGTSGQTAAGNQGCVSSDSQVCGEPVADWIAHAGFRLMRHGVMTQRTRAVVRCARPGGGDRICATERHVVMVIGRGQMTMETYCNLEGCSAPYEADVLNFWSIDRNKAVGCGGVLLTQKVDNRVHRLLDWMELRVSRSIHTAAWALLWPLHI